MKPADALLRNMAKPLPEIAALRQVSSKTFNAGGGKRLIACALGPIHYDGGSGLEEIDTAPRVSGSDLVVDKTPYILTISRSLPSFTFEARGKQGTIKTTLTKLDGRTLNTKDMEAVVVPDGIEYRGLAPSLTIILRIRGAEVEWFKRLGSAAAPKVFEWTIERDAIYTTPIGLATRGLDTLGRPLDMQLDSGTEVSIGGGKLRTIVTETFNDRVSEIVDRKTRRRDWLAPGVVVYPILIDAPTIYTISATTEDTEQKRTAGGFTTPDDDGHAGELVVGGQPEYAATYWYYSGWRFDGITLASGDTVSVAEFKFNVQSVTGGGPDAADIVFDDADDPPTWGNYTDGPFNITATTAVTNIGTALQSTGAKTEDVKAQVDEIKARGGWATGQAMRIVIRDNTPADNAFAGIDDFELGGGTPATLEITIAGVGANPHGPFGHPFHGPFAGPVN